MDRIEIDILSVSPYFDFTWFAGDEEEHIGTYAEVAAAPLNIVGVNALLGAVEYAPAAPTSFVYQRHVHTMGYPCEDDWDRGKGQLYPSHLEPHAVVLSPDLLGQFAGDAEPRSTAGELNLSRRSLGRREEIRWSSEENPTWAVEVRLNTVRVVECEDCEDESMTEDEDEDGNTPTLLARGISDYEVRATILRAFVQSEKIVQL
ncbi:hypothetical protein DFH09DRAFT_1105420 [Mycena vulgaris]|nr:hypothetical protein DFH09DRAFT_1105420 [Mycena vulgaris]